jgi:hypothetical protein
MITRGEIRYPNPARPCHIVRNPVTQDQIQHLSISLMITIGPTSGNARYLPECDSVMEYWM